MNVKKRVDAYNKPDGHVNPIHILGYDKEKHKEMLLDATETVLADTNHSGSDSTGICLVNLKISDGGWN